MENKVLIEKLSELLQILDGTAKARSDSKDYLSNLPPVILGKEEENLLELLDNLRVCCKYQAFSEEAALRENNYLRKLLMNQDE